MRGQREGEWEGEEGTDRVGLVDHLPSGERAMGSQRARAKRRGRKEGEEGTQRPVKARPVGVAPAEDVRAGEGDDLLVCSRAGANERGGGKGTGGRSACLPAPTRRASPNRKDAPENPILSPNTALKCPAPLAPSGSLSLIDSPRCAAAASADE